MILALIAIVPIVLERIHNEQFDRGERIDAAYSEVLGLARRAASLQSDVIVSTRTVLQVLAASRIVSSPSAPSCDTMLKGIAEPDRWIRALSVANLAGRVVCSSHPEALGLDVSKRTHFINAVKTGQFVVSNYFMGTRDVTPLIIAAMPQRGADGKIDAVVLATLDLNWLGQITGTLAKRPGAIMLVIDGKGTVLAHEPNTGAWIGRHLAGHPFVKQMMARGEGVTEATLDGSRRILAYVALPGTTAHVAFGLDEREVLGRADAAMWIAFADLGLVSLIVLLGIWFGAESLLVRPIRVLVDTARRIGSGEDKARAADLPWVAEFTPLAVALDEMTDRLEAREQELHDLNNQLRELAHLDSLTGLANRRTFNAQLLTEWKNAVKRRHAISVLMIDVDHFKAFNDRYGHVQGDRCLRKVGEVLRSRTRAYGDLAAMRTDARAGPEEKPAAPARDRQLAARYGGEEFAVLLPDRCLDDAAQIAEELRQAVEDLLIAHTAAPLGFVSISVGVASIVPDAVSNPQDLTESADARLYEAKQLGRNTVVVDSDVTLLRARA
jgi:GGDEF domain-containing protein